MSGAAESGAEKSGGDDKAKKKKTVFKAPASARAAEMPSALQEARDGNHKRVFSAAPVS